MTSHGPSQPTTQLARIMFAVAVCVVAASIGHRTVGGLGLPTASAASSTDVMTVEGVKLLRDGAPFEVHGVEYVATAGPPGWLASGGPSGRGFPIYLKAYQHLQASASTSFDHARSYFGANTIEFKVSQSGYDVEDGLFSLSEHEKYVAEIKDAASLARSKGFVVILVTLNNQVAGNTARMNFPTAATERVDVALAEAFKGDLGVILEVDNEPWPAVRVSGSEMWAAYLGGGPGRNGVPQVGVQQIVEKMRSTGAQNLILVEPYFHYGFADYPGGLTDPANNLGFGIHPYLQQVGVSTADWDAYFGDFAATHPVIVTEWSETSGPLGKLPHSWCTGPETLEIPHRLLEYIGDRGVDGVTGWAYDFPGTLLLNYDSRATAMTGCGERGSNVGEWMRQFFIERSR